MLANELIEAGLIVVGAVSSHLGLKVNDPIFIVGTGRCGTTLLVKMLESHKQLITYPSEANNLWHPKSYPYGKRSIQTPPILEDPERFSILSIEHWPAKQQKRIHNTLTGFHVIRGSSKSYIVKSAMISFLIPNVLSIFPGARFIHIYRSGPPVVESLVVKEWEKYQDYFDSKAEFRNKCAKYWNDCIVEIEKQKMELSLDTKGKLLEFSYEQLCENPRALLDNLGKFIGISPSGFAFDISKISSRNYKAGDYDHDAAWVAALKIMHPAMSLKGYALPSPELSRI